MQYLSDAKQWKKGQLSISGTRLEIKNADSPKIVVELTRSTKLHIHKESSPTPFTFVVKFGNTAIPMCLEKESIRRYSPISSDLLSSRKWIKVIKSRMRQRYQQVFKEISH